ncbi:hypothetical protein [Teichococcus aestuarii]|uniref:hypothetical protein n=1 Tax=Teichococcus aestuarii TaxID=568898 RepID=UPI00361B4FA0
MGAQEALHAQALLVPGRGAGLDEAQVALDPLALLRQQAIAVAPQRRHGGGVGWRVLRRP